VRCELVKHIPSRMTKQSADDEWASHPIISRAAPLLSTKSSVAVTFINLVKSMFGAGFLALPYAVRNIGYIGGLVGVPLLTICIELGIRCLLRVKRELRVRGYRDEELTYAGIGRILLGKVGLVAVLITLAVGQLGTCAAYIIFTQQTMTQFYDGLPGWAYGIMMASLQMLLCQIRVLDGLRWTSAVGCVLVLLIFTTIYIYNLHSLGKEGASADLVPFDGRVRYFPRFIGIVTFAIEGITMVLPLEAAMREPKYFMTVVDGSLVACAIVLLTFGELGYMVYGDATNDMITQNMSGAIVQIVDGLLMVNLIFTFPIQMFPVTEILDKEFVPRDSSHRELWRTLIRIVCVSAVSTFAILVPSLGGTLGIMGGFCFIFIGVLFPVLFFLILFEEILSSCKFWGLIVLAIIASSVSMLVTVNAIIDTVSGD